MDEYIYEALREEPNVDMVIIKDQLPDTTMFEQIIWEYAIGQLHKEAEAIDL